MEVRLPIEQWQQVLAILATAPWSQANPLIMAIGEQLRQRAEATAAREAAAKRGNGADHPEAAPTS
jgi:hypothetical protein